MVLSVAPGHGIGYYTRGVAEGRSSYYTGATATGEPAGRWYGEGARALGLQGEVDEQDLTALYEHQVDPRDPGFRDPAKWSTAGRLGQGPRNYRTADELYEEALAGEPTAGPERRAELRASAADRAKHNVAYYDATFSVQKSVTVLHAAFEAEQVKAERAGDTESAKAWSAYRQAVEDAIWAGNNAALDYLQERAGYSRVGHHGGAAGRFVDAHGWTVASFFQHDSRDHDPQLHIHNPILNVVQCPDGEWRAVDGGSIYAHKHAAAAVAERTTEERLSQVLRIRFATRPDGKAREVVGIDKQVLDLFSSRSRVITPKIAELVNAYRAKFGREPQPVEVDHMRRQTWKATRRSKERDGETTEERLVRWDRELRAEIGDGLGKVALDVLRESRIANREAERFDEAAVLELAAADVQGRRAAWTSSNLTQSVNAALPDHLGTSEPAEIVKLLDGLTAKAVERHGVKLDAELPGDRTLPTGLRLDNGQSAYMRPGSQLFSTREQLRVERELAEAATSTDAAKVTREEANAFIERLREQGVELGVDQAAAVRRVMSSGQRVEAIVGPAGTGKSFVVGQLAHGWESHGRRVHGLATSQAATEVLADEGLHARNITRWRDTQARLAAGKGIGDDQEWQLRPGDLVVVDESAMTDTRDLAGIHRLTEANGAKLLMVGDHRQLSAVGPAGGMDLAVAASGAYELVEARRFSNQWEREASLKLREGDTGALEEYRKHGRIRDGGTLEEVERSAGDAWLADTLAGERSLLITDTNEHAARMNAQLRARLVELGRVEEDGVPLDREGTTAGLGDIIQARRNGWELERFEGNSGAPINRMRYRVVGTRHDGGLVVEPEHGGDRLTLPGRYVSKDATLAYASTVHSAQGQTVDTGHTIATDRTDAAALYVSLSRGMRSNTAHVVTRPVPEDAPPGAVPDTTRLDPVAVLRAPVEREQTERSATVEQEEAAEQAATLQTAVERLSDASAEAAQARTSTWLDRMADDGLISRDQRAQVAAERDYLPGLSRMLRRVEIAGHDPERALRDAASSRSLADAESVAKLLRHRVQEQNDLTPKAGTFGELVPAVDDEEWAEHLREVARVADERRLELGQDVAASKPLWAQKELGRLPGDDLAARSAWVDRAATVESARTLLDWHDEERALPEAPKPDRVEAYATWRAGWRALGRPEDTREESEMSAGQLRMRVRALDREETWAPDWVEHELAGTKLAEAKHRETATLRGAEAQAARDEQTRARAADEAASAGALATLLDSRAKELEQADQVRGKWYAHTAETRVRADRARLELSQRGVDDEPAERTTADEWLAAHRDEQTDDEVRRPVRDTTEFADVAERRERAKAEARDVTRDSGTPEAHATGEVRDRGGEERLHHDDDSRAESTPAAETAVPDIREEHEHEPVRAPRDESSWQRVPTADETRESVERARVALREIHRRDSIDHEGDQVTREMTLRRWHAEDEARAETTAREPVMTRGE